MLSKKSIRFSKHPLARLLRSAYYLPYSFSVPAPRFVLVAYRSVYTTGRSVIHFIRRVFIAEPMLKAYCTSYGKRLHAGIFVHWIQGKGSLLLGDDVRIDGKSSFKFAAHYTDEPTFTVGSRTGIGHACSFTIGKAIKIGSDCRIASNVVMFDSPGHPADPELRRAGAAAPAEDVRPISIGNNVWIGSKSTIFPGVTIGDNSIVFMGSCVTTDVPSDTIVGGNPARKVKSLATGNDA